MTATACADSILTITPCADSIKAYGVTVNFWENIMPGVDPTLTPILVPLLCFLLTYVLPGFIGWLQEYQRVKRLE